MTIEEAKEKAKILEKLNLKMWQIPDTNERKRLNMLFKECVKNITVAGFKIRRSKKYDPVLGFKTPRYNIAEDCTERIMDIVDNRPANTNYKNDCTTRCISFCTGVDYDTIRKEQMKNSEHECHSYGWKLERNWSKSFLSREFVKIVLPRKVSRKTFVNLFKDKINDGIIGTLSSGHIAAIDMNRKKILDLYNSSGGRIKALYVPSALCTTYKDAIEKTFAKRS